MKNKYSAFLLLILVSAGLFAKDGFFGWKEVWKFNTGEKQSSILEFDPMNGRLLITAGNYLEFGSPNSTVISLRAIDGKDVWKYKNNRVFTFEKDEEGVLFGLDMDRKVLVQIDAKTGNKVKTHKPYNLRNPTGEKKQKFPPGKKWTVHHNELVYFENENKSWDHKESGGNDIVHVKYYEDKLCYSANKIHVVRCLDIKNGKELWTYTVKKVKNIQEPDQVQFSFEIVGKRVIIAHYDGYVTAADFDG